MKRFFLATSLLSMTIMSFGKLLLKYEWKYLDILWDNPRQKEEAIYFGKYDPNLAYLYDIDRANGKLTLLINFCNNSLYGDSLWISLYI